MKKIHAKSCIIKEINNVELERSFLDENHRQGYTKSYKRYGLFYRDQLVFLMTFGSPRFNKNYQWEIIRECSKKDYIIYEATSTVWNYFLRKNRCHSCICYSYPHKDSYTDHYVKYCGFKNIQKTYKKRKIFYVGVFNNKKYDISIQNLRRFGVDRILNIDFGGGRGNNEDILETLGFKKELLPTVLLLIYSSILYRKLFSQKRNIAQSVTVFMVLIILIALLFLITSHHFCLDFYYYYYY